MKNLVSTDWLEKNLNNVRILDASWHMPSTGRNPMDEFLNIHIQNANFFDLDKTSNQSSNLPHMLPEKKKLGEICFRTWYQKFRSYNYL